MHELLRESDIESQFKPIYYLAVPVNYVNDISITYADNTIKRLTAQQATNTYRCLDGKIRLSDIYEDVSISQTEVSINFKRIANEINNAILHMHHKYCETKTKS